MKMTWIYGPVAETARNIQDNDIYNYYLRKGAKTYFALKETEKEFRAEEHKRLTKDGQEKARIRNKQINDQENLTIYEKCSDKYDFCEDKYIDMDSLRKTNDGVIVFNTRSMLKSYPGLYEFAQYSKIIPDGIDCKAREFVNKRGRRGFVSLAEASPSQKAVFNIVRDDKLFNLVCSSGPFSNISKSSNQIFYGSNNQKINIKELDKSDNLKMNKGKIETEFHALCKDASDYEGCIRFHKNK